MDTPEIRKVKDALQCFSRPIYETVISTLTEMIETGELAPGTKFPPDKKLAIELGISHVTLAKALNELRRRNVLERRRATGTFVPMLRTIDSHPRRKIAVVFDYASEETFQQHLFLQLHHGLEALDCTMLFFSSNNNAAKQLRQLREIVADFSISGCIVWSILNPAQAADILQARPRYYPLIFMDKYYPGVEHDAVTYANFECGAALARSLIRRKISHCLWLEEAAKHDASSVVDRRNGVRTALKSETRFEVCELTDDDASLPRSVADDCALVFADANSAARYRLHNLAQGIPLAKHLFTFETVLTDPAELPEFTAYRFPCELGNEAIKILASRLNGKESCTVNHSGKWSVLGAKRVIKTGKKT